MTTDNIMQDRLTMPTRSVTNPKFRYTPAKHTDVARTWRKFALLLRIQSAAKPAPMPMFNHFYASDEAALTAQIERGEA